MTIRTAIQVSALRRSEYQQTVVKRAPRLAPTPPAPGVQLTELLGYLDFLCLTKNARGVISDSGGVQAEATHLNVPCLTLRKETEQPVTVDLGANTLVHFDFEEVLQRVDTVCEGNGKRAQPIPYCHGRTAEQITEVLLKH